MFQLIEAEDVIRVDPISFGTSLNKAAAKILKTKYESTLSPEFGYIILIIDVKAEKTGKILPSDAATYHSVSFKILTYMPKLQEVVEGEVVEITDFGAFIRIGPVDALYICHKLLMNILTVMLDKVLYPHSKVIV